MKRDMNLVRGLLMEVEGEAPKPDLSEYSQEQQAYHGALLIEAGLVKGEEISDGNGYPASVVMIRLTWAGHEFLDAARDENVWKKVLEKVSKVGGAVTLPILKQLLSKILKEKFGLEVELSE